MKEIVLGIDGGGSKIRCIAADLSGNILGFGTDGPVNCLFVSIEDAIKHICNAVNKTLESIENPQIILACCGSPTPLEIIKEGIEKVSKVKEIINTGEMNISLTGALLSDIGIIVIAGTGSLAGGKNPEGKTFHCGGWGPFIGDEGSGYWIGAKAINAISKSVDKRLPKTLLVERVLGYFNLNNINELVPYIYKRIPTRYEIAQISPIVTKSAEEGDKIAQNILKEAGEELALLATTTIRELNYPEARVSMSGGVFTSNSKFILETFKERVKVSYPKVSIVFPPILPPVGGAIISAFRALNKDESQLIDNLKKFFGRSYYA
ncbi:MAG: hypothetical protein N2380_02460 [bacterium]|nr:hypothetical protein [bacterium]